MKIIQELTDRMTEEIEDGKWYAERAAFYKEENPAVSQLYLKISDEEMAHMSRLHDTVVAIIKEYRTRNGEPPADMLAVYNYLHKKVIEKAGEVRVIQTISR